MFGMITRLLSAGSIGIVGKRWKEILIAGMIVVIGYQNLSDTRWVLWADTIPFLRTELATAAYELEIVSQANATLTSAIEERNAEIQRWSDVTMQLEQSTALLQDEISGINLQSKERIKIIEKEVIPQECSGAMNFLYDSVPELQYNDILQLDGEGL